MSTSGHNPFHIDRLVRRDNYGSWKFAIQAYFELEDLWSCVTGTNTDERKETEAKSKLILLLDPIIHVHVQSATTCKEVWESLERAFDDSGLYRRVALLRDLITTTLESSRSVDDYVNKIMSTAHKLRNIKFNIDDEWLGTLMLAGLPETYKPMIMGLESSDIKIGADSIKTKLLQEQYTFLLMISRRREGGASGSRSRNNIREITKYPPLDSKHPHLTLIHLYGTTRAIQKRRIREPIPVFAHPRFNANISLTEVDIREASSGGEMNAHPPRDRRARRPQYLSQGSHISFVFLDAVISALLSGCDSSGGPPFAEKKFCLVQIDTRTRC